MAGASGWLEADAGSATRLARATAASARARGNGRRNIGSSSWDRVAWTRDAATWAGPGGPATPRGAGFVPGTTGARDRMYPPAMRVLGIETSCDDTAAAVVEHGPGGPVVRSSVVA